MKAKSERRVKAEALACTHKPCGNILSAGLFRDGAMTREIMWEVTRGMSSDDELRVMTNVAVRRAAWCECAT